jgi:hypothetical protein
VLHYLAIASAAGVEWTIDDFERVRRRVPVLCDLKPSGKYVATDFHRAAACRRCCACSRPRVLHGDCITITGRRIGEELERVPAKPRDGQDVIRPWDKPMYAEGHLAILRGNLRAEGCVAKITGLKNPSITGPARVFDSESQCMEAIMAKKIRAGDVRRDPLRRPEGRPGMQEMLAPTSALIGRGSASRSASSPTAASRAHWGMVVGHVAPEAQAGGTDRARARRRLDHDRRAQAADPAQRRQRRAREAPRRVEGAAPRYTKGLLAKYMKLVSTASLGAITRRRLTGTDRRRAVRRVDCAAFARRAVALVNPASSRRSPAKVGNPEAWSRSPARGRRVVRLRARQRQNDSGTQSLRNQEDRPRAVRHDLADPRRHALRRQDRAPFRLDPHRRGARGPQHRRGLVLLAMRGSSFVAHELMKKAGRVRIHDRMERYTIRAQAPAHDVRASSSARRSRAPAPCGSTTSSWRCGP